MSFASIMIDSCHHGTRGDPLHCNKPRIMVNQMKKKLNELILINQIKYNLTCVCKANENKMERKLENYEQNIWDF